MNTNTNTDNTNTPKKDSMISKFKKNREVVQNELKDLTPNTPSINVSEVNEGVTTSKNDVVDVIEKTNVTDTKPIKKTPVKKKKIYTEKYLIAFSPKQKQTLEELSERKTKKLSDLIKEAIKAHYSLSDDEF